MTDGIVELPKTPGPTLGQTPASEGPQPPGVDPSRSWAEAMRQVKPQAGIPVPAKGN